MRHRARIVGVHQIALERVLQDFFAKLSAIFQRPEEVAVIVCFGRFGERAVAVGIGNDVGKGFLEKIVHSYAKHKEIQAAL